MVGHNVCFIHVSQGSSQTRAASVASQSARHLAGESIAQIGLCFDLLPELGRGQAQGLGTFDHQA